MTDVDKFVGAVLDELVDLPAAVSPLRSVEFDLSVLPYQERLGGVGPEVCLGDLCHVPGHLRVQSRPAPSFDRHIPSFPTPKPMQDRRKPRDCSPHAG